MVIEQYKGEVVSSSVLDECLYNRDIDIVCSVVQRHGMWICS